MFKKISSLFSPKVKWTEPNFLFLQYNGNPTGAKTLREMYASGTMKGLSSCSKCKQPSVAKVQGIIEDRYSDGNKVNWTLKVESLCLYCGSVSGEKIVNMD